jgi:hypothetical protein
MADLIVSFTASCRVVSQEEFAGVHSIGSGYRPNLFLKGDYFPCMVELTGPELAPGAVGDLHLNAIVPEDAVQKFQAGVEFELREVPHTIARGVISRVETPKPIQAQ